MPSTQRDDFRSSTKAALAKRSAFLCAICQAVTIGPSAESANSIINVGVAAHITAASPGPGASRYDASITSAARADITNGIWLCTIHGKLIDDDCVQWTVAKLKETKRRHEEYVTSIIGIPSQSQNQVFGVHKDHEARLSAPREFAFVHVRMLNDSYKSVLRPMLRDRGLTEDAELGVLMRGSAPEESGRQHKEAPWTVFVNADWLRWFLNGQSSGYKAATEVPPEQIYGQIPAWPDSFFEFLAAIVQKNATFEWRRHRDGYLVLSQNPKVLRRTRQ